MCLFRVRETISKSSIGSIRHVTDNISVAIIIIIMTLKLTSTRMNTFSIIIILTISHRYHFQHASYHVPTKPVLLSGTDSTACSSSGNYGPSNLKEVLYVFNLKPIEKSSHFALQEWEHGVRAAVGFLEQHWLSLCMAVYTDESNYKLVLGCSLWNWIPHHMGRH